VLKVVDVEHLRVGELGQPRQQPLEPREQRGVVEGPFGSVFGVPRVDIMTIIFSDFLPIFDEKNGAFLKNQSDDAYFAKISSIFNKKTLIFSPNFSAKLF
jgi:hypothetical protein